MMKISESFSLAMTPSMIEVGNIMKILELFLNLFDQRDFSTLRLFSSQWNIWSMI